MRLTQNINLTSKGFTFVDKHQKKLSSGEFFSKTTSRIANWILEFQLYVLNMVSDALPFWSIRKIFFQGSGLKIGKSTIHMGSRFYEPKGISIGDDTIIGNRVVLDGRAPLHIGNHVDFASEVMVYNSEHDLSSSDFHATNEPVTIEDYVFVGPRAIILPGVTLGKGSVVAAGAVVTKSVPEFTIVAGVPARVIGERQNKNPDYQLGRARLFQ